MNINPNKISVLTRDRVRELSSGEVTSPHIFDEMTEGYDDNGLFSKKIFGTVKDFTCVCSDNSKPNKAGQKCSQCGTVYDEAKRRNNKFGHIDFVFPLLHPIWGTDVESLLIIPPAYRPADLDVTNNYIIPEHISNLKEYDIKERTKPGGFIIPFILKKWNEQAYKVIKNEPPVKKLPKFKIAKDIQNVFYPEEINPNEYNLNNESEYEISDDEYKKFEKRVLGYRKIVLGDPNSNNPVYSELNIIIPEDPNEANKSKKKKSEKKYVIKFNKTDINYLYSKLIEYNNTIKTFIAYKSNSRIYKLFEYCYTNYHNNAKSRSKITETSEASNDEQSTDSTKLKNFAEKDIETLLSFKRMSRDLKCEIIKNNFRPIFNCFEENGRFTGKQYDKFRSVYRYAFKDYIKLDEIVSEEVFTNLFDKQINNQRMWMQKDFNVLIKKGAKKEETTDNTKKKPKSVSISDGETQEDPFVENEILTEEDLLFEEEDRMTYDDEPSTFTDESEQNSSEAAQDETEDNIVNEHNIIKNNIDGDSEDDYTPQKEYSGNIDIVYDMNFRINVKSLVSKLTGKGGHFRDAALGKRVDYSGRSVIVVEPNMKIDEVGLPFEMAMILFEPYLIQELKKLQQVNVKGLLRYYNQYYGITSRQAIKNRFHKKLVETLKNFNIQIENSNDCFERFSDFILTTFFIKFWEYYNKLNALFEATGDYHKVIKVINQHLETTKYQKSICQSLLFVREHITLKEMLKTYLFEIVWVLLEKIIRDRVILLVRNPSLHRMNVQAFKPRLTSKKAIKFHSLVLKQFGADIDGDTMAIFLPLSKKAQGEAKTLMLSGNYVFSPANGEPVNAPSQDMLLGLYYLTKQINEDYDNSPVFSNINEAVIANDINQIRTSSKKGVSDSNSLHKNIKLRHQGNIIETTMGRAIFNSILPDGYKYINYQLRKKSINELIKEIYEGTKDVKLTNKFLEDLKDLGLRYATSSGLSIGLDTIKDDFIDTTTIEKIEKQKDDCFNSDKDLDEINILLNLYVKYFKDITDKANNEVFKKLETLNDGLHPLQIMLDSGARGTKAQLIQILGIKGYLNVSKDKFDKRDFIPHYFITSRLNKGYKQIFDYIVSAKMSRKLQYSESINVPMTGYLARKLVYFADDIVVNDSNDCGTNEGIDVYIFINSKKISDSELTDRLYGRVINEDISIKYQESDNISVKLELKKGDIIDNKTLKHISGSKVHKINVRTPLKCKKEDGCCPICYGMDLARAKPVKKGTPIGVIAAQSLSEPLTQLQLKNFHTGGVSQGGSIEDSFKIISGLLHGSQDGIGLTIDFSNFQTKNDAINYQREVMTEIIYKTFKSCGASINKKHIELIVKKLVILGKLKRVKDFYLIDINKGFASSLTKKEYKKYEKRNKKIKIEEELFVIRKESRSYYNYKGITNISDVKNGALKKLSFQNIQKHLKDIVVNKECDDLSSMASSKIKGELINAGTGMVGCAYFDD